MLAIEGLSVSYGGVQAVSDLDLEVGPGEVVALLGPNGAGKSTTLRAVSGLVSHGGTVTIDGVEVDDPVAARRAGLVHLPQGRGLFRRLTVAQNLTLGAYGAPTADVRDALSEAEVRIPELRQWARRPVATLSGGEQALVALGRLVVGRPRYALLDEPALGLSPVACDRLYTEIEALREADVALVLVEQYAARALAIADRVVVLDRGRVSFSGPPADIGDAGQLIAAYLGARR